MAATQNDDTSPTKKAVRDTADNVREDLASAREAASEDLAQLRSDLARLSETVSTLLGHQADAARDTASTLYSGGKETLGVAQAQAKDAGAEMAAVIERNPLTAVAAAFGAGLLIGILNRGR